jgi:hypothetical protein
LLSSIIRQSCAYRLLIASIICHRPDTGVIPLPLSRRAKGNSKARNTSGRLPHHP